MKVFKMLIKFRVHSIAGTFIVGARKVTSSLIKNLMELSEMLFCLV